MAEKTLFDLLDCLQLPSPSVEDCVISGLAIDSRKVKPGNLFIALKGHQVDGMRFAKQAQQQGAVAIFAESPVADELREKSLSVPVIEVTELGQQLGVLADYFYNHPSEQLKVIAITGTNGKTSTAWLMVQALEALGVNAAYMGTLGFGQLDDLGKLDNTTPSALAIQMHLADMVKQGIQYVCIEASSHALVQGRINGLQIDTAVLTNISQDHLDYHKSMAAYAEAKHKLFTEYPLRHAVINGEDEYGQQWLQQGMQSTSLSVYGEAGSLPSQQQSMDEQHKAQSVKLTEHGISFTWVYGSHHHDIETQLMGRFNVDNLLALMSCLTGLGFDPGQISKVIPNLTPVPGRMNTIKLSQKSVSVVIDFAHTPDALEQVLKALGAHCQHDLWCVFGCGGDRDRSKRPLMGRIAEANADHVIITDDNPRFESAAKIAGEIAYGMKNQPTVIHNRTQAIEHVLERSNDGDVVLIAGKGHETTQQINDQYFELNDLDVVCKWQEAVA